MEVSLRVTVLLGQTEINHVDLVAALADAHKEVVRLDVTVDEGLGMDVLNAGDELVGKEKDRLEGELAVAEVEKVLQTRAEEVQNHGIVVALGAEPADEGNTDTTGEGLVDTGFIFQLRVLSLDALKLDGDFFARNYIGAYICVSNVLEREHIMGSYPSRCHQNCHYQSCGRFCICCRHGDPVCPSASALQRVHAVGRGRSYHCRHICGGSTLRRLTCS